MKATSDVEDVIDHPYSLEVSLRPHQAIEKWEDFKRNEGKPCRIVTSEKIEDRNEFQGTIIYASEDKVEIRGTIDIYAIPIYAIKSKFEFEF